MKKGYQDRVVQHSLKWVNGNPQHNHVDDECVADFSCCHPDLFTQDMEKRMRSHQHLLDKLRQAEESDHG